MNVWQLVKKIVGDTHTQAMVPWHLSADLLEEILWQGEEAVRRTAKNFEPKSVASFYNNTLVTNTHWIAIFRLYNNAVSNAET